MAHEHFADRAQPSVPEVSCFDLCRAAMWSEQARQLVVAGRRPRQILEALERAEHLDDAIRFLSLVMPKRKSIWWGALCCWHGYRGCPTSQELSALEASLNWLSEPNDSRRRTAEAAAKKATPKTAAGALAFGVFMSGGSISLPDLPFVPPAPDACGQLVAGAVMLAAVAREPLAYLDQYRLYLSIGRDVADGRLGWLAIDQAVAGDTGRHRQPPAPHMHAAAQSRRHGAARP